MRGDVKGVYLPDMCEYRFVLDGELVHFRDEWVDRMWNTTVARETWRDTWAFMENVAWWRFGYTDDQSTLL